MKTDRLRFTTWLGTMMLLAMLFSCQTMAAKRNVVAVPKSETRTVRVAHNLVVEGPFNVVLTPALEPGRLEIYSDSTFLPYIETEVLDLTMTVRVSPNKPRKVQPAVPITIRMNHDWLNLQFGGAVTVGCEEIIQNSDMNVVLNGNVSANLNLMCINLKMEVTGHSSFQGNVESSFLDVTVEQSSDFTARGVVEKVLGYCSSNSQLNCEKMICNHMYLQCYRNSNVVVYPTELLDVTASEDSQVSYVGDCREVAAKDETTKKVLQQLK